MPNYRRMWVSGGVYFFTVTLLGRHHNDLLVRHIDALREAVAYVRARHPFKTHGWVVLPDHLHCVIELPTDDADYATRWSLIKQRFSRTIPDTEYRSDSRMDHAERGIWARRFWEHVIRDERDYAHHMDYVHLNPVKHGLVLRVADWPYFTFHPLVRRGVYLADWVKPDLLPDLDYD